MNPINASIIRSEDITAPFGEATSFNFHFKFAIIGLLDIAAWSYKAPCGTNKKRNCLVYQFDCENNDVKDVRSVVRFQRPGGMLNPKSRC